MRLTDLSPEWCHDYNAEGQSFMQAEDLTVENAQGVIFLCPSCFVKNGGEVGTHSVLAWFRDRGVPDDATPGPGRWTVSGTGFEDLTLSPSIDLTANGAHPDEWHGNITNGGVDGVPEPAPAPAPAEDPAAS